MEKVILRPVLDSGGGLTNVWRLDISGEMLIALQGKSFCVCGSRIEGNNTELDVMVLGEAVDFGAEISAIRARTAESVENFMKTGVLGCE